MVTQKRKGLRSYSIKDVYIHKIRGIIYVERS